MFRLPCAFDQTTSDVQQPLFQLSVSIRNTYFDVSVSLSVPLHANSTCMCWPNTYYYNLPAPGKGGFHDNNNQHLSIPLG
jgi:hypothetical protein